MYLAFDYDYAGEAPMCDGYADGDYAPEGYTREADAGGGYYNNDYLYTSWRLELDCSLLLLYVYVC